MIYINIYMINVMFFIGNSKRTFFLSLVKMDATIKTAILKVKIGIMDMYFCEFNSIILGKTHLKMIFSRN